MSKFSERVDSYLEGVEFFSPGSNYMCPTCNPCEKPPEDWNDPDCTQEFSTYACESCNSPLAGDRFSAHGNIDGKMVHFDICIDCRMYHAYGDEPKEEEES